MNAAHLHLLFTHLPIVGLGIAILINLYAIFKNSIELKKLSLFSYSVLGIFALLAYMTGDGAGEIIRTFPSISNELIETHEIIAFYYFIGLMILAAVAGIGLYITKTNQPLLKKFIIYLLIFAVLLCFLAYKTGESGGEIRHPEIIQNYLKM